MSIKEFLEELRDLELLTQVSIENQAIFDLNISTFLHVNPSLKDINDAIARLEGKYKAGMETVKELLLKVK